MNTELTKREYFAVQALQGLLSTCCSEGYDLSPNRETIEYFSKLSVTAADMLLKELEKTEE